MPASVRVGHGSTVVFGTSGFTAEFKTIGFSGSSREPIDTTHLSSPAGDVDKMGGKTFLMSPIADPGQMALEFHLDPDVIVPVNGPMEPITITWPLQADEDTAAQWTFTGAVQDWDANVETEDVVQGTLTVKISGQITVVPAVPTP